MVTYTCPNCGFKLEIGLEVRVTLGKPSQRGRSCPKCGMEMRREK